MSWMKVDEQIGRHPKHLKVEPAASWLWLCSIGYARNALSDGYVPREALDVLGRFKKPERLALQLVLAGLWRVDEARDGWVINDYLAMNPTKVDVLDQRAKDSARKKAPLPAGIHSESNGIPDDGSARARSISLSVSSGGVDRTPEMPTRTAPLIASQRRDIAMPGRVPLPGSLLVEFAAKLGGPNPEKRVLDWASGLLDSFPDDAPIPDSADSFVFWRKAARALFPQSRPETRADRNTQQTKSAVDAVIARRLAQ